MRICQRPENAFLKEPKRQLSDATGIMMHRAAYNSISGAHGAIVDSTSASKVRTIAMSTGLLLSIFYIIAWRTALRGDFRTGNGFLRLISYAAMSVSTICLNRSKSSGDAGLALNANLIA